jgi:hypothetical protein
MIRFLLALALCGFASLAHADDGDDKHWYKNEFSCWGKKYVIRNYCENEPDRNVNKRCDSEELLLDVGGIAKVVSLHSHQPYKDDIFWVGTVQCGEIDDRKYFYLNFDNGGNCDECEVSATLSDDGTWVHFGDKWFVKRTLKKKALRAQRKWFKSPSYFIKNKTLDEQQ